MNQEKQSESETYSFRITTQNIRIEVNFSKVFYEIESYSSCFKLPGYRRQHNSSYGTSQHRMEENGEQICLNMNKA